MAAQNQFATRRTMKQAATTTNTASTKYATKRTLKHRQSIRTHQS
jgi:hypothetical protein